MTISLLVPFRPDPDSPERLRNWEWLRQYWRFQIPGVEIVEGDSDSEIFSKTKAVNNAAKMAKGDVFVILDSDALMPGYVIENCARSIGFALVTRRPLWYIPYRNLYRLTQEVSELLTSIHPMFAMQINSPPDPEQVESTQGSMHGRRFGAMIQIIPREGFELVGGMDERFVGWGGEDVALVRALDTLYVNHKTTDNDVLHLWHTNIGTNSKTRMWQGQHSPRPNEQLASRYNQATGDVAAMRSLVDEWRQ